MEEQEIGGKEVLTGLSRMKDQAEEVKSSTARVRENTGGILDSMESLSLSSEELIRLLSEVNRGMTLIDQERQAMETLSLENEENIKTIAQRIKLFKT